MKCKYNGLGCGHETGCTRCQADAEAKCKTYNYLVWLDDNFSDYYLKWLMDNH
jgi:hypothetical protein